MDITCIIAVQNTRIGGDDRSPASESEPISKELATAINDGIYFYEQVDSPLFFLVANWSNLYLWWSYVLSSVLAVFSDMLFPQQFDYTWVMFTPWNVF